MQEEQIVWLDFHKPISVSYGVHDIIIKYRKNRVYDEIVFG